MKRILLSVMATIAILALVACGGGSSSTTSSNPSSAPVTINVGDATADRLLAFEVTVNSVTLTGASGATGNLLASAAKIELTHLSGKFEPLRLMTVPAGTYTGASFTLGAAEAVIIPQAGGAPVEKPVTVPSAPITITFPAVTVGATASVLNFDFNLATLVTVTGDTVTFANPIPANAVTVVASQVGQNDNEAENEENENGELEDIHGTVGTVGSSTFTLNVENNPTALTFNVDANTQCSDGLTGAGTACLATLKQNMVVKVEGVTKADGSLLAKEIEGSETETGLEAEGLITSTTPATGVPVTAVQIVVHESTSAQAAQPAVTAKVSITLPTQASAFRVDLGHGKTAISNQSLAFGSSNIGLGQKIEADEDVAGTDNLTAKKIKLKKQALSGTATGVSSAGFTLTFSTDSFFKQLTGEASIKVITPGGMIQKGAAPAENQTIRVRGLLFFNPAAATGSKYTLVAGRADH